MGGGYRSKKEALKILLVLREVIIIVKSPNNLVRQIGSGYNKGGVIGSGYNRGGVVERGYNMGGVIRSGYNMGRVIIGEGL